MEKPVLTLRREDAKGREKIPWATTEDTESTEK